MKRYLDWRFLKLSAAVALCAATSVAAAVNIDFVTVGNPGNASDTRYNSIAVGAVGEIFQIGKYEVTAGQYCEFLNAVAKADPYGLYNTSTDSDPYGCQITRHGSSGSYSYDFSGRPSGAESDWTNRPVNYVSWGDSARFINWLENGQPAGILTGNPAQDGALTENGTYDLNGATTNAPLMAVARKPNTTYWIPNEDEWYKAAYYDPAKPGGAGYWDYPTRTDAAPSNLVWPTDPGNNSDYYAGYHTIGNPYFRTPAGEFENSEGPYNTFDQGGNVWEWNETPLAGVSRGIRGGGFYSSYTGQAASTRYYYYYQPTLEGYEYGFRVAKVPEPSSIAMLAAIGLIGGLAWAGRRRLSPEVAHRPWF